MYTDPFRREFYTKDGGIEPFMPTVSWGYLKETDDGVKTQEYLTYLQNNNEDIINWHKNHPCQSPKLKYCFILKYSFNTDFV